MPRMQNLNLRSFKFRQVLFRFQCNILCENCEINEFETVAVEMKSKKCFHSFKEGIFFFFNGAMVVTDLYLGTLEL